MRVDARGLVTIRYGEQYDKIMLSTLSPAKLQLMDLVFEQLPIFVKKVG